MALKIRPIQAFNDNYIWLLHHHGSQRACVVDPGDARPVIEYLSRRELTLESILVTHHHPDHVGGVKRLAEHYGATVYGPASQHFRDVDVVLHESDTCRILDATFRVMTVPGHTLDHIAYFHHEPGDRPLLFAGDTLFAGGCGRLFEGTPLQMLESLNSLRQLPDDTLVYCAHEYTLANLRFALAVEPDNERLQQRFREAEATRRREEPTVPSTLAEEKATNPFLRWSEPAVIASAQRHAGMRDTDSTAVFAAVRAWKDVF